MFNSRISFFCFMCWKYGDVGAELVGCHKGVWKSLHGIYEVKIISLCMYVLDVESPWLSESRDSELFGCFL